MKNLSKLGQLIQENVPLILLLGQLVVSSVKGPSFPDAFIILSLSAVYGFKLFTEYKPRKDISTQLAEQKLEIYKEMSLMKQDLMDSVTKSTFNINPGVKSGPKEPVKRIHF